jgi:O-antigen/teichoic acid export membrane protein
MGAVFPFGLAAVAVYTRYLEPAAFGKLAVLLVVAALLSLACSFPALRGTLSWTFGASDDEEIPDSRAEPTGGDKRRALTTGLVLLVAVVSAVGLALMPWARQLSSILVGNSADADLVRWTIASGAAGAVWRLVVNVPRMERRPVLFGALSVLRPVLVLAVAIPLLVSGSGVVSVLVGTTLGTALAIALAIATTASSYAARMGKRDLRQILRLGSRWQWIIIVLSIWVVTSADVLFIARLADDAAAGEYRLASRIAAFGSYFVSAFLMAWTPLQRTALVTGAYGAAGRSAVASILTTYYVVCATAIVLVFSIAGDLLVKVAAPAYSGAADLIPLIGAGFALYGLFIVLVRVGRVRHRVPTYCALAVAAAAVFSLLCVLLIPVMGGYGAALAMIAAMALASGVYAVVIRRSRDPIPVPWLRVMLIPLVAGACWLLATRVPVGGVVAAVILGGTCLVAFPVLLVATSVIPRGHLRALGSVGLGVLPRRNGSAALVQGIEQLPTMRRAVLELALRDRLGLDGTARELSMSTADVAAITIRAVRQLAGLRGVGQDDESVGMALLADGSVADRDGRVRRLIDDGHPALELADLEVVITSLRRSPRRAWRRASV